MISSCYKNGNQTKISIYIQWDTQNFIFNAPLSKKFTVLPPHLPKITHRLSFQRQSPATAHGPRNTLRYYNENSKHRWKTNPRRHALVQWTTTTTGINSQPEGRARAHMKLRAISRSAESLISGQNSNRHLHPCISAFSNTRGSSRAIIIPRLYHHGKCL